MVRIVSDLAEGVKWESLSSRVIAPGITVSLPQGFLLLAREQGWGQHGEVMGPMSCRPGLQCSLRSPFQRLMPRTAHCHFSSRRASLRRGDGGPRRCLIPPVRKLLTQLAFKVTGSPATLSLAVRGYHRG